MTNWRAFSPPAHRTFAFFIPGVYVLYWAGRVVYVGHASDLRKRLNCHALRFRFDRFKVRLQFDRLERQRLEQRLLFRLKPVYNTKLTKNRKLPDSAGYSRKYTSDSDRRIG